MADNGRSWLASDEWQAALEAAEELEGKSHGPSEFLKALVNGALVKLQAGQDPKDHVDFAVVDLTEEDRWELFDAAGYDVDDGKVVDVITDMPDHTIISDGTARKVATTAVADSVTPDADLALFAATGAIREGLRPIVSDLAGRSSDLRDRRDLERLGKYIDSAGLRGPADGWATLEVPGWLGSPRRPFAAEAGPRGRLSELADGFEL